MKITALAHTCYCVRNIDAAVDFYCNKLGLPLAFDFVDEQGTRTGVYLHLGGRNFLELFIGEVAERTCNSGHICLEVEDLPATIAELRERGVTVEDMRLGGDNSWQSWLTDQDGNGIEFHQYIPGSWQAAALQRLGVD